MRSTQKQSAGVMSLEHRWEQSLARVGYSEGVGRLPAEAKRSERLTRFLEWLVDVAQPENCLAPAELEGYDALKSTGSILKGAELERALSRLGCSDGTDSVRQEVEALKESAVPLKAQLQTLSTAQRALNEHYATLLRERDALTRSKREARQKHQEAVEEAEEANSKVNAALDDLNQAVTDVVSFHRGDDRAGGSTAAVFLSEVPLEQYHAAEDRFLGELTEYTKKQFFQGIAVMAHSGGDGGGGEGSGQDKLGDGYELLRGLSPEEHERYSKEILRLKAIYPLSAAQRMSSLAAEQHTLAACRKAKEELAALSQRLEAGGATRQTESVMRRQLELKQTHITELQSQIQDLSGTQLPTLLRDMAALQMTAVLHGDYDLKIARQDYFLSKQERVIAHLQSQRARHELLAMLAELELSRHRKTHRLLAAATSQLQAWATERERRESCVQNTALVPVNAVRQTVDSRDHFTLRLCSLLGVKPSPTAPLILHASLASAVEQLTNQIANLEAIAKDRYSEQQQIASESAALLSELEQVVFGSLGSSVDAPQLTVKEFDDGCHKLLTVLGTLEQNIKSVLKTYEEKRKVLKANPLMEVERNLFVHFFTAPDKLSRIVGELAQRVDALATAQAP